MPTPYDYGLWRCHSGTVGGWRHIQPTQGSYAGTGTDQSAMVLDWTAFDGLIADAITQGVELCWHVWLTPTWASIPGDQVGGSNTVLGPWNLVGESAVPSNFQFVRDITTAILQRAIAQGRRIKYIEPLNEPEFFNASELAAAIAANRRPFWTGTPAQAVRYAWNVYEAAKAVDPDVIVLMPSQFAPTRMAAFLSAQDPVSGKFGHETFDWVNLHPYVAAPNQAIHGEDLFYMGGSRIGVQEANRRMIAAGAQPKPIIVTEWGLDTQPTDARVIAFNALPTAQRRNYIRRMFAMAALGGVRQFTIFSNNILAGDYTNDTDGVIAGVNDAQAALAGKTIVSGGYRPTGVVEFATADGLSYAW